MFQSTPPHGGRPEQSPAETLPSDVSIHTPARGATGTISNPLRQYFSFNPHPRTGGDIQSGKAQLNIVKFQSTPPHGGRPEKAMISSQLSMFQSTPPHGGRLGQLISEDIDHRCFNPHPRTGGDLLILSRCGG